VHLMQGPRTHTAHHMQGYDLQVMPGQWCP
jgi:hypothetical protein